MPDVIDVKAPAPESKGADPKPDSKPEAKAPAEEKAGDIFKKESAAPEPKMVPESALLDFKKENKKLWKEVEKLQDLVTEGATKKEVSGSLKEIATKYNVDENFLLELSSQMKVDTDAEVDKKLKPIEEKDNAAKIDKIFTEHYDKTLDQMPEYKDIANREVIKSLTLDPSNANKTFAQIIEAAYGHLLTGKRTLDAAKPRGGREPAGIDYDKARKDTEYFKEVMADPALRKEYNSELHKRLRL